MQQQIEDATRQYYRSVRKSRQKALRFTIIFLMMLVLYLLPWDNFLR